MHQRGDTFSYLGFNLQDPVVGQLPVRQAIAHAIDREAIIRHVLGGDARTAATLLVPEHWAANPELKAPAYDPQQSRQILASLGYGPDRPLEISYKTSSNPNRIRLATVIQHQLKAVGIQLNIQSYDWGTFYADIKAGRFQMYSLSWVGLKLPDIFRYVFHSDSIPPTGANRGRYQSDEADRLIESAELAGSPSAQQSDYRSLQAVLLRDLPYVPLWYEDQVIVHGTMIRDYTGGASDNYDGLNRAGKYQQ